MSDENKVAEEKAKAAEQVEKDRVHAVMSTALGRAFLMSVIFDDAGVLAGSFVPGDALAGAFNEGRRAIGCMLLARLDRLEPSLLAVAYKEHSDAVIRARDMTDKQEDNQ